MRSVPDVQRTGLDQVRRHCVLRDLPRDSARSAPVRYRTSARDRVSRGHRPACRRGIVGVCGARGVHRKAHHATGREPVLARAIRRSADVDRLASFGRTRRQAVALVRIHARRHRAARRRCTRGVAHPPPRDRALPPGDRRVAERDRRLASRARNHRRLLARLDAGVSSQGRAALRWQGHGRRRDRSFNPARQSHVLDRSG